MCYMRLDSSEFDATSSILREASDEFVDIAQTLWDASCCELPGNTLWVHDEAAELRSELSTLAGEYTFEAQQVSARAGLTTNASVVTVTSAAWGDATDGTGIMPDPTFGYGELFAHVPTLDNFGYGGLVAPAPTSTITDDPTFGYGGLLTPAPTSTITEDPIFGYGGLLTPAPTSTITEDPTFGYGGLVAPGAQVGYWGPLLQKLQAEQTRLDPFGTVEYPPIFA